MKFVSSREFRINPGSVWRRLRREKDLVITSNGKPVGVMTFVDEDNLEDVLATLRQGRAQAAVAHLRQRAVAEGLDKLSDRTVQSIVRKSRSNRRRRVVGERR
jgi:prevent-host-death family protein